jgi:hypothetical protein
MWRRNKRFALAGAALSTAIAVGVLCLSGGTATATGASHKLKFIAVDTSQSTPTKSGAYYEAYVAVASGSTTADGVLNCVAGTSSEYCHVAQAYANGIIDAYFKLNFKTGTLKGTVTGGTGAYKNASGTVNGTPTDAGEAVTVTYTT